MNSPTLLDGDDIRRLRKASGLSQVRLAELAGTHQPNLSAIESGLVRPTEATLARLRAVLLRRPSELLAQNRERIRDIIAAYSGSNPRVFGSVARGEDRPDSDLDILIDLPPGATLLDVVGIELDLREALGIKVDVIHDGDRGGPVLARARQEAAPL